MRLYLFQLVDSLHVELPMFLNLEYVARAAPDFGAQRDLCTLVKGSVTIAIKVIFGDQF